MTRDERPDDWAGPETGDAETRRRLDELLAVLASRPRRDVLYHLAVVEVTDVETLATTLAARRERVPPTEVSDEGREQVLIELVHTHLPKLVDVGVVEYDRRSSSLRYREPPPQLERLMESCREIEVEQSSKDGCHA